MKLHYLALPCKTPGRAGLALLENIKHDRLPHQVNEWPVSSGVHAGTIRAAEHSTETVIRNMLPAIRRIEALENALDDFACFDEIDTDLTADDTPPQESSPQRRRIRSNSKDLSSD